MGSKVCCGAIEGYGPPVPRQPNPPLCANPRLRRNSVFQKSAEDRVLPGSARRAGKRTPSKGDRCALIEVFGCNYRIPFGGALLFAIFALVLLSQMPKQKHPTAS